MYTKTVLYMKHRQSTMKHRRKHDDGRQRTEDKGLDDDALGDGGVMITSFDHRCEYVSRVREYDRRRSTSAPRRLERRASDRSRRARKRIDICRHLTTRDDDDETNARER